MEKLKAYRVQDLDNFEGCSTVVFAESRNKARRLAMSTDACEYGEYIRIRATRLPELDSEYRGHFEMDWYNDQDRMAMVSQGWRCSDPDRDECVVCSCKEDCEDYQDYLTDAFWEAEDG